MGTFIHSHRAEREQETRTVVPHSVPSPSLGLASGAGMASALADSRANAYVNTPRAALKRLREGRDFPLL